ncbi:MAG: imelysin family protein [Myxococcales bacterium]|nr:imelysin family protein [Myxococcales bacterium]
MVACADASDRSWAGFSSVTLVALVVWAVSGCSEARGEFTADAGGANDGRSRGRAGGSGGRGALLRSVTTRVVLPALRDFAEQAQGLHQATKALVESGNDGTARDAARAAFVTAMDTWQSLEMLQVGPAGVPGIVMGGEGLRDEIYSWPTASACRVDQEVVANGVWSDDFFERTLVNAYGLDALEYLLFVDGGGNDCPTTLSINSEGQWAMLASGDVAARRAAYAEAVAGRLLADARALRDAWEPREGDFAGRLEAGRDPYASGQEALDGLFAAMFYVDQQVKDRKLAGPAGISGRCSRTICPQDRESLWANRSKEYVAANLRALRALYTGGPEHDERSFGFDRLLEEMGAGELGSELRDGIDRAIEAVEALDGSLVDALDRDPASVEAAHAAVKGVTDLFKSQFVTVLNLRVPREGAGDND